MDVYGWNSTYYADNEPTHLPKVESPSLNMDDIEGGCELCGEPVFHYDHRISFWSHGKWHLCHTECAQDNFDWFLKELDIKEETIWYSDN